MNPKEFGNFCEHMVSLWTNVTDQETARVILHKELDKMPLEEVRDLHWFFSSLRNVQMISFVGQYLLTTNRSEKKVCHSKTHTYASVDHLLFDSGWNGKVIEKDSQSTS